MELAGEGSTILGSDQEGVKLIRQAGPSRGLGQSEPPAVAGGLLAVDTHPLPQAVLTSS
jgi:hypothetical protein